jgi:hypothetical protein
LRKDALGLRRIVNKLAATKFDKNQSVIIGRLTPADRRDRSFAVFDGVFDGVFGAANLPAEFSENCSLAGPICRWLAVASVTAPRTPVHLIVNRSSTASLPATFHCETHSDQALRVQILR